MDGYCPPKSLFYGIIVLLKSSVPITCTAETDQLWKYCIGWRKEKMSWTLDFTRPVSSLNRLWYVNETEETVLVIRLVGGSDSSNTPV